MRTMVKMVLVLLFGVLTFLNAADRVNIKNVNISYAEAKNVFDKLKKHGIYFVQNGKVLVASDVTCEKLFNATRKLDVEIKYFNNLHTYKIIINGIGKIRLNKDEIYDYSIKMDDISIAHNEVLPFSYDVKYFEQGKEIANMSYMISDFFFKMLYKWKE